VLQIAANFARNISSKFGYYPNRPYDHAALISLNKTERARYTQTHKRRYSATPATSEA